VLRQDPQINDSVLDLPQQRAVESGEALGLHLAQPAGLDLPIGAGTEPPSGQFLGPVAHALTDVVPGDHQVVTAPGLAAQQERGVRVVGVVVIDRNPLQFGAEIGGHPAHQRTGELPQLPEFQTILSRDDEAELVTVALAALLEGGSVRQLGVGAIGAATLIRPTQFLPLQVANMPPGGSPQPHLQHHQPGLDDDATGSRPGPVPTHGKSHVTAAADPRTAAANSAQRSR
jgi:hypothetical protein